MRRVKHQTFQIWQKLFPLNNDTSPEDAMIAIELKESITKVLSSLKPREERVLRMRFGIGLKTDATLEEVGQKFSLSRDRIRQIEAVSLRKLKNASNMRTLKAA